MNTAAFFDAVYTPCVAIFRWCEWAGKPGTYRVVAKYPELAYAQGDPVGGVHYHAVVDDFGNLVRVPS